MTVELVSPNGVWPPGEVDWDYQDDQRVLMHADCRGVLPILSDDSVDLVVTDPPYGMSFMGKDWDKVLPDPAIWRECLRVLKPGAFAFVMSSPRADLLSRMIASLEGAGFNVGFTPIFWAYACLSADTEVLTQDGWKDWEQLRMSTIRDKIVVYDTETEIFQFESPSAWHSYRVREDLLRIESQDTEQLVTHNHRVLTPIGMVYADHLEDEASVVYLPRMPAYIRCVPGGGSQETRQCGALLFPPLSGEGDDSGANSQWQARPSDVRGTEAAAARGHDGRQEPSLEGWRDLLQDTRELRRCQVRQMPTGISGDGPQGRLRDGASPACGATVGQTVTTNRSRPPQEPRSNRQQSGRDALRQQPASQAVRGGESYRTTLARVHRQRYDGVVYCPTVSTGCFVARRNGKIFLTGNSGFPKAQNMGKAVDKRRGTHPDTSREFAAYIKVRRKELGLSLTYVDTQVCNGTTNYSWFEGRPAGQRLPRLSEYVSMKSLLGLDDRYDEFMGEAERDVIGEGVAGLGKNAPAHDGGYKAEYDLTISATPQARALDGSYAGFQPKPAVEVIIVAMKPLSEKTYVDQALANGHGVTWLDAGRIPHNGKTPGGTKGTTALLGGGITDRAPVDQSTGRFPANLLCSDDVLDDGSIHGVSGAAKTGRVNPKGLDYSKPDDLLGMGRSPKTGTLHNDSGSFSRYFDLDAWWAERIKSLPESVQRTFPFLEVTKASKREKNLGCDALYWLDGESIDEQRYAQLVDENLTRPKADQHRVACGNIHATVKSVKLMLYLIELGSRPGDVVLDPFCGSGSTLLPADAADRYSIGVERDESAYEIASSRCAAAAVDRIRRGEY